MSTLISVAVLLLIILFATFKFFEGFNQDNSSLTRSIFTKEGRSTDQHWSSHQLVAEHENLCLTDSPYYTKQASNAYHQNLPDYIVSKHRDCDRYQCKTDSNNGEKAEYNEPEQSYRPDNSIAVSIDPDYYSNQAEYCHKYPDRYPCQNWWNARNKHHELTENLGQKNRRYDRTLNFSDKSSNKIGKVKFSKPFVKLGCQEYSDASLKMDGGEIVTNTVVTGETKAICSYQGETYPQISDGKALWIVEGKKQDALRS